jgi:hypothetical protein
MCHFVHDPWEIPFEPNVVAVCRVGEARIQRDHCDIDSDGCQRSGDKRCDAIAAFVSAARRPLRSGC